MNRAKEKTYTWAELQAARLSAVRAFVDRVKDAHAKFGVLADYETIMAAVLSATERGAALEINYAQEKPNEIRERMKRGGRETSGDILKGSK